MSKLTAQGNSQNRLFKIKYLPRQREGTNKNYRSDFRRGNCKGTQNYRGQNFRGGYRGNIRMKTLEEVEGGLEKDGIQLI